MSGKRTYGDACGIARALDVVGDRWALLVVRELLLGPKRFTDLRDGLPHLGPDVLSQRLKELEQAGVVQRGKLPPPAGSRVYELTPWGAELEPVLVRFGRWGSRAEFPEGHGALGVDALIVALKSLFEPARAGGADGCYELRLGDQRFSIEVDELELQIKRGEAEDPDAAIDTDPGTLQEVLWHGRSPRELGITGDRGAAARFLALFPLPS